jgi:hypothetical protein
VPPQSENESEEDSDGAPGDADGGEVHAIKKARFEGFRKTLVGKSVVVSSPFLYAYVFLLLAHLTVIPPR